MASIPDKSLKDINIEQNEGCTLLVVLDVHCLWFGCKCRTLPLTPKLHAM